MYRIMIVFALAGMTFFAGCGKKTAITIPESLIGTTWDGNNGGVERFSLVFGNARRLESRKEADGKNIYRQRIILMFEAEQRR